MSIKSKIFIAMSLILILPFVVLDIIDYNHELAEVTERIKVQIKNVVRINTVTNQAFMWSRAAMRDRLGDHFYQLPENIQNDLIMVGADGLDVTMEMLNQSLEDTVIWYSWGEKIATYIENRGDYTYTQLPKDSLDRKILAEGGEFYGVVSWDGDPEMYKPGTQVFRGVFGVRILDKTPVDLRGREIEFMAACASCHLVDMGVDPEKTMAVVSVAFDMEHTLANAKKKLIVSIITVSLMIVAILMVLLYLLNQMIFKPIKALEDSFRDIAQGDGDLTQRLPVTRRDEVGRVADLFNQFMGNIQKVINDIDGTANTLAASSEELHATSTQIERTTREVNESIEGSNDQLRRTTADIQQMATSIEQISGKVSQVQQISVQASKDAQTGTESVASSNKAIAKIEESSKQILGIMDVINQISNQTNLLSLNAAIEAAKAGELGKGFAVVADEVRNLSGRSADATQKIQRLMEVSYANVYEGTQVIARTGKILSGIIDQVSKISGHINEVNQAVNQQSNATGSLAKAAQDLSQNSQSNAQAIRELSKAIREVDATTEDLSHMADKLKAQVNTFKT